MRAIVYFVSIFILFSCNKEKRFSNRLMKKEKWQVVDIYVDGTKSQFFGNWTVSQNVDIYDSVPSTIWMWDNQDAVFNWQFQDKGKSFQLNYQQQCLECNASDLDSLDYFLYNISGKYQVQKHGLNKMIFTSTNSFLYSGKKVEINIRKVK